MATQSGTIRVKFTIAVSPRPAPGEAERTMWFSASMFGKRAEAVAPFLLKGTAVHVRGDLDLRPWQGRDGTTQQSLDVVVSELDLLGSKGDGQQQSAPARQSTQRAAPENDEDVPF